MTSTTLRYSGYWEVEFNPPIQGQNVYRFASLQLVWDSVDITWGKFPQHERPVLELVAPGIREYTLRDHSGTLIGTCKWVEPTYEIYIEPTHM